MASTDRRMIAPMMVDHFPSLANPELTSDDWHGFMNAVSGLDVDPIEPNSVAFDKWRQALAETMGLPVWGYTKEQIAAIKKRGEELKKKEDDRQKAEADRLKLLAAIAPTKTPQQLIDDTKKAARQ